jgi:hypothetical protein
VAVVVLEADDIGAAMRTLATSQEPFDTWFREVLEDVHGIDLSEASRHRSRSWTTEPERHRIHRDARSADA